MMMLVVVLIVLVLFLSDVCESANTVVSSYNTGYIVQTIYSDKQTNITTGCSNPVKSHAIVLGQCIVLDTKEFNEPTITNATVIKSVKYKWDFSLGFQVMSFYSDTACATVDNTKTAKPNSGLLFNVLDTCTTYNSGLNSYKMTYYSTYSGALSAVQSVSTNYTLTTSYSSADYCTGTSTAVPVYMESTEINNCYATSTATSSYTTCFDNQVSYDRMYTNTLCDSSKKGYSVSYTYTPSCSSFNSYNLYDGTSTFPHTFVAGYEVTSCGVYNDSSKIITLAYALPIALAVFFFSMSFCLCLYIFFYAHRGGFSPPPRLSKDQKGASV